MSQALGSLGSVFSGLGGGGDGGVPGWMKLILGGLTGAGEIGNIAANRQRGQLMSEEQKWAKLTPQQLAAKVSGATAPLSQGLTQAVGNTVQGELGERGLAQAPGIFNASLAQALAPYYQRNQEMALQAILQQMGLPIEMARLLPGNTDLAPLLKLLLGSFQGGGKGGMNPLAAALSSITGQGAQETPVDIADWSLPTMASPDAFGATSAMTTPFGMPMGTGATAGLTSPFGGG